MYVLACKFCFVKSKPMFTRCYISYLSTMLKIIMFK